MWFVWIEVDEDKKEKMANLQNVVAAFKKWDTYLDNVIHCL